MADFRLSKKRTGEPKQAVPIDSATSTSLLQQAGGTALSGLHTLGSLLSAPSRLLHGTINAATGGEGGFGNLNPFDSTGGIEGSHHLVRAGILPENDPTKWEWGDLARGAADIALDPMSWLGIGGLSKAGVQAAKQGVHHGLIEGLRNGTRGLVSLHTPISSVSKGAIGSGADIANAVEAVHNRSTGLIGRGLERTGLPTKVRQLFHASAMGRSTPATQDVARQAYGDITNRLQRADLEVVNAARNRQAMPHGDLGGEAHRSLMESGVPTAQMRPVVQMSNEMHTRAQRLGIPVGTLENTVKPFTKVGPKKAAVTHVLDEQGNVVQTIANQQKAGPPLSFSQHVQRLANNAPQADKFYDNKAFIAPLWEASQRDPHFPRMTLDDFKQQLVQANHGRELNLGRADLVKFMDPNLVRNSETNHLNAQFHFVITNRPADKAAKSVNYLVPNTATQHAARFVGEGVDWGRHGGSGFSKKPLSASASMNTGRNEALFGNARTGTIETGIRSTAGLQPRLAEAGFTANQQARILGKRVKKVIAEEDRALGTNLTKKFVNDGRVESRTRNLGEFIQRNPQIGQTGLFTNDPLFDAQHQLHTLGTIIPKAQRTIEYMSQHAAPEIGDSLDVLRRHGMDNAPTVREAAGQLGLEERRVGQHVYAGLPQNVRQHIDAETAREATRRVIDQFRGQTPTPQELGTAFDRLLPGLRHQATLNLQLPAGDFRSLTGILDRAAELPDTLKSANTIWKANMLAHPATQTRNAVSAGITNLLQNGANPLSMARSTKEATDLIRGKAMSGYEQIPEVAQLMASQNIDQAEALRRLMAVHFPAGHNIDLPPGQAGAQLADVAANVPGQRFVPASEMVTGPAGALAGFRGGEHLGWQALNPTAIGGALGHQQTSFAPAMASNMVAQNVEQAHRIGGALDLLKQGYSLPEAARKIGSTQVSYGPREYSQFEKQLKTFVPFYSFNSRAAKNVATELASHPGGPMAQVVKTQDRSNAQDPSIPDSILSGTALPVGEAADGTKRYLTGIGLAHESPVHTLGALAHGDLSGAGYDALALLNPLLSKPLEHITQKSFSQRGAPLNSLDPTLGRLLSNVGSMTGVRDEAAGPVSFPGSSAVENALAVSPFSRALSTARSLTDTRKDAGTKAINTLTGLRLQDVSPGKQEHTLRSRAEQLALANGGKSRSEVYFSKADLEALKEANPALFARQKELQQLLNALKAKSKKPKASKAKSGEFRLSKAS